VAGRWLAVAVVVIVALWARSSLTGEGLRPGKPESAPRVPVARPSEYVDACIYYLKWENGVQTGARNVIRLALSSNHRTMAATVPKGYEITVSRIYYTPPEERPDVNYGRHGTTAQTFRLKPAARKIDVCAVVSRPAEVPISEASGCQYYVQWSAGNGLAGDIDAIGSWTGKDGQGASFYPRLGYKITYFHSHPAADWHSRTEDGYMFSVTNQRIQRLLVCARKQ
jgi:hypothetical protein